MGTPANAFYDRLNQVLDQHHFDRTLEHLCRRYYKGRRGRPSITPGVYFRVLLLGYWEGVDSERGIAWRLADSLSLRKFIAPGHRRPAMGRLVEDGTETLHRARHRKRQMV